KLTPPGVLYPMDGVWQDVAAEAWTQKAATAGHAVQDYQWDNLGNDVVARVKIDNKWWDLTYDRANPSQVYAAPTDDHGEWASDRALDQSELDRSKRDPWRPPTAVP